MTGLKVKPRPPQALPTKEFHAKLAESLLDDPKLIKAHGFAPCVGTPDKRSSLRGILIPYFDLKGKVESDFWRYRFLEDTRKGFDKVTSKKAQRYTQPLKKAPRAYFSPVVPWTKVAGDVSVPVVITEGEFKAACGCVQGFATIGLGGVWNFTEKTSNARVLIPDLESFSWEGREVFVCYDSDAVHNDQVRKAEFRVAEILTVKGAHVKVARLPSLEDGKKCGIDDYFLAGNSREDFQWVLDKAEPFAELEALFRLNLELAVVMNPVCYYVKYSHEQDGYLQKLDVGAVRTQKDMAEALATKFILQENPPKKDGSPSPPSQVPLFLRWYHWEGRTTVKRMSYDPGAAGINGELLNTWSGWGVDPVTDEQLAGKPLDIQPWIDLLDVVFEGIEPEHRQWFERWVAYPFQHPGAKLLSCVILSSINHGVGKSFISEIIARIYGRGGDPYVRRCLNGTSDHVNAGKIDLMALTSGRNDWARAKQFVFGEDVRGTTVSEGREIRDQLKDAITRTTVRVDEKYMRPIEFEDRCNLMFSTNDPTVFQMDDEDRRFFVVETTAAPRSNEFYQRIDNWSKSHGPSHLHRYFLEMDLGDFAPNTRPPLTSTKIHVQDANSTWVDQWARDLMTATRKTLAGEYGLPVRQLYAPEDLLKILDPEDNLHISRNALGRALRAARVPVTKQLRLPDGRQRVLYAPAGMSGLPTGLTALGKLYMDERGLASAEQKEENNGKKAPKYSRGR